MMWNIQAWLPPQTWLHKKAQSTSEAQAPAFRDFIKHQIFGNIKAWLRCRVALWHSLYTFNSNLGNPIKDFYWIKGDGANFRGSFFSALFFGELLVLMMFSFEEFDLIIWWECLTTTKCLWQVNVYFCFLCYATLEV